MMCVCVPFTFLPLFTLSSLLPPAPRLRPSAVCNWQLDSKKLPSLSLSWMVSVRSFVRAALGFGGGRDALVERPRQRERIEGERERRWAFCSRCVCVGEMPPFQISPLLPFSNRPTTHNGKVVHTSSRKKTLHTQDEDDSEHYRDCLFFFFLFFLYPLLPDSGGHPCRFRGGEVPSFVAFSSSFFALQWIFQGGI